MKPASLPDEWVRRIWSTMRANYGAAFDRQWQCPPGVEPADHVAELQRVWAKELGVFFTNHKALEFALENLPERPPSLPEFRALCRRRPDAPQSPVLPAPKPDPRVMRRALELIGGAMKQGRASVEPFGWAWDLRYAELFNNGRTARGRELTRATRKAWREALARRLGPYLEDAAVRTPFDLEELEQGNPCEPRSSPATNA